jgi:hypothetical protein
MPGQKKLDVDQTCSLTMTLASIVSMEGQVQWFHS